MKLNEKKETLLKQLREVNHEVFEKVHEGDCFHDIIGNDFNHFVEALRYVPNHVIKKWIRKCKSDLKEHKEEKNENTIRIRLPSP